MSISAPRGILLAGRWLAFWALGVVCLQTGCDRSETTQETAKDTWPKYEVAEEVGGMDREQPDAQGTKQ